MIGVAIEMVEEILAVEISLRHAPIELLQEPEVAVDIDHGRHNGFARQVDARRTGRKPKLTFPADAGEPIVIDNECRAFNRRLAIAHYQPRTFEECLFGGRLRLAGEVRRTEIRNEQTVKRKFHGDLTYS